MSILDRWFKRRPNASLDSVSFEVSRYTFGGEDGDQRVWFTPDGDGLGVFFFPKPPNIPHVRTTSELEQFYRSSVCNEEVKMVEFRLMQVLDVTSVWIVVKTPQEPSGMSYLGSVTIPFAEFSFVIKMQCEEHGITGVREASLMLKAQQDKTVAVDDDGRISGDWQPDDVRYDEMFPTHPISRLRRELTSIIATVRIEEVTRNEKRLDLPGPGS